MNRTVLVSLVLGTAAAIVGGSAAAAGPSHLTSSDVAQQVQQLEIIPYARFDTVVCRVNSKRLMLFRCTATYRTSDGDRTAVVWARERLGGQRTVCASTRKPVPAACLSTADGPRDLEGHGEDVFRRWRGATQGYRLDQAGSECVEHGSGFFTCVDRPVGGEVFSPVWARVVLSVSGERVIPFT